MGLANALGLQVTSSYSLSAMDVLCSENLSDLPNATLMKSCLWILIRGPHIPDPYALHAMTVEGTGKLTLLGKENGEEVRGRVSRFFQVKFPASIAADKASSSEQQANLTKSSCAVLKQDHNRACFVGLP